MEDHEDILARYKRMRAATRGMNNALLDLCKPSVKQAAKDLGVLVNDTVVMDVDRMPVLMDHAIYHGGQGGRNAIERYAAEHPPAAGSDAQAALHAMQAAFFSLFQVRDVVEGVGVRVTDLLRDQEHFLADVGFSQSAVEGIVLAARVLPFEGFIMTTGAALPVETDVLEWVAGSVGRSGMSAESMRELSPEVWAQVEAKVVHACLHSEGNQRITYEDVPGGVPAATLSKDPAHVGRNAPCPCGSGRKYKKCCGRQ